MVPTASSPQGHRTWTADYQSAGDSWTSLSSTKLFSLNSTYSPYSIPDAVLQSARQVRFWGGIGGNLGAIRGELMGESVGI